MRLVRATFLASLAFVSIPFRTTMSTSAASDKVKSIITGLDINIIKNIDLLPISKGAVDESKAEIKANDLIDINTDEPVLFYIVRRPG